MVLKLEKSTLNITNSSNYNVSKITKLQRRACKVILESLYVDLESAMKKLNILTFDQLFLES